MNMLSCSNTANKGDDSWVNSTSEKMPRVHSNQDLNCSNLFQSHEFNLLHSAKTAPEKEAKLEV